MKKENLGFGVARDFFIEMKSYTVHNYVKKCRYVGFCSFEYRSCSQY